MALPKLFQSRTSRHERAAGAYQSTVNQINDLAEKFRSFSDEELKQSVRQYYGQELREIKEHLPQIFAGIREAADRTLQMRHFDVQLMGGLALLDGTIAEMKTGEGKTLVATLPLIVHGLTGQGAHLVTVNDYLSQRDADWMRPVYEFFDLTVGIIATGQSPAEKREQYRADITYGTNNEYGFDYLRDNMATRPEDVTQRELNYALIDEVDSILIDEARTPLIISAPDTESTQLYQRFAGIVPQLEENTHYNIDEKRRAATLTDDGITKVEQLLGLDNIYAENGIRMVHHLEQALRAQTLYRRDKDYVVKDGQVIIVDEFTGRLMEGRRYSEGLHQAIEAKEKVKVQQETRTLATITFQNFFRLYQSMGGMTGTAVTSAEEFEKVYNLEVVVIPTNKNLVRLDKSDRIYVNEKAKFAAVVAEIRERHTQGQPVLVGTIAIEKSEYLSGLLQREGVPHEVLNAKHHQREAEIISQAGQKGAVTISTNMAGRGTDIKLGDGVAALGGLYVLGTERHEARRIDNQLRGRSGRQGDPGETRFFVSLEDDVMRVFGGGRLQGIMQRLKLPETEAIENKMVNRALEGAQERVEGYYFDMRKQVLSYDDVLSRQREAIYTLRKGIMRKDTWTEPEIGSEPLLEHIPVLVQEQAELIVAAHTGEGQPEQWDTHELAQIIYSLTGEEVEKVNLELQAQTQTESAGGPIRARQALTKTVEKKLKGRLQTRAEELGQDVLLQLERAASIRAIDLHWMDHLDTMDYLRTGIGLRGYGQRDPLVEYQKEGFRLFQELLQTIKSSIVETVFKAEAIKEQPSPASEAVAQHPSVSAPHISSPSQERPQSSPALEQGQITNPHKNIGRNDPCWCDSGKKFKKCHGQTTSA